MHTDQLSAVSAPEGDELVFYPEPSALRRGVLAGIAIIVISAGLAWHVGHSAFPHPAWQVLAGGGCIGGVLLGAAVVASTLARYPRLRLVRNLLVVEGPFRQKIHDLSLLGKAHVVLFRFRRTRHLYLTFLTRDEDQARRQSGLRHPPKLSEMHTGIMLGALVGSDRQVAQSIVDVINARRPQTGEYTLSQEEVEGHLKKLRRRRLFSIGMIIVLVIVGAFAKAFFT